MCGRRVDVEARGLNSGALSKHRILSYLGLLLERAEQHRLSAVSGERLASARCRSTREAQRAAC
eukprot:8527637-Prorocentrum_lima.AAC.1